MITRKIDEEMPVVNAGVGKNDAGAGKKARTPAYAWEEPRLNHTIPSSPMIFVLSRATVPPDLSISLETA
jgi:hypothetical protein